MRLVMLVAGLVATTAAAVRVIGELTLFVPPSGATVILFEQVRPDGGARVEFIARNDGRAPVNVSSAGFFGDDAGVFVLEGRAPVTIPAGVTEPYAVRFTPSGVGSHAARVVFETDDATGQHSELVLCAVASETPSGVAVACDAPLPPAPPDPSPRQGCSTTGGLGVMSALVLWSRRARRASGAQN